MVKGIESTPTERIKDAIEDAELAFWAVIADRFPEATSGDLSVERTIGLDQMMHSAVNEWVDNNFPEWEDVQHNIERTR